MEQHTTGKQLSLHQVSRTLYQVSQGFQTVGETVFHCLFCHGFEERGSPSAGLLLDNPMVLGHLVEIAGMASKLADKVTIYTNGQDFTTMPNPREGDLLALQTRLERHGFKFDSRPITKIVAHELSIDLVFDGSQTSHRFCRISLNKRYATNTLCSLSESSSCLQVMWKLCQWARLPMLQEFCCRRQLHVSATSLWSYQHGHHCWCQRSPPPDSRRASVGCCCNFPDNVM